jgi:flagellar hook assembly protein FlgD
MMAVMPSLSSHLAGQQPAGSYNVQWNAIDENGSNLPSGFYIIQMQTEKTRQVQKVLLMK